MPSGRKVKDIVGKKFGRLTVLSFAFLERNAHWNCLCDCGKKKIVISASLQSGKTKSCGCWNREKKIERIVAWSKKPYKDKGYIEKYHQGESHSYSATHHWLNRTAKYPAKCEMCGVLGMLVGGGRNGQRWNIEYAQKKGFPMKKDLNCFFTLCSSCHKSYDQKGRKKSLEFCKRIGDLSRGRIVSEETRKKMSESAKKQDWSSHRTPEFREKVRQRMLGNTHVLGKRWKIKKV